MTSPAAPLLLLMLLGGSVAGCLGEPEIQPRAVGKVPDPVPIEEPPPLPPFVPFNRTTTFERSAAGPCPEVPGATGGCPTSRYLEQFAPYEEIEGLRGQIDHEGLSFTTDTDPVVNWTIFAVPNTYSAGRPVELASIQGRLPLTMPHVEVDLGLGMAIEHRFELPESRLRSDSFYGKATMTYNLLNHTGLYVPRVPVERVIDVDKTVGFCGPPMIGSCPFLVNGDMIGHTVRGNANSLNLTLTWETKSPLSEQFRLHIACETANGNRCDGGNLNWYGTSPLVIRFDEDFLRGPGASLVIYASAAGPEALWGFGEYPAIIEEDVEVTLQGSYTDWTYLYNGTAHDRWLDEER